MKENLFGNTISRFTSVFFLAFAMLLVFTSHGDIVLWVNKRHSLMLDQLFKNWTYLGDGLLLGIFCLILLLTNYYRVLTFLVGVTLQTIFVHILSSIGYLRICNIFVHILSSIGYLRIYSNSVHIMSSIVYLRIY